MMLWAILFFLLAVVTGILGFTGVAVAITFYAKLLFFIATIFFMLFLILVLLNKATDKGQEKD